MSIGDDLKYQWRHGGAVKRLLFVNIGVFLAVKVVYLIGWSMGQPDAFEAKALSYLMATNNGPTLLRQPWTVITYMFTHQTVGHILGNMIIFWFSGQLFQSVLGDRRLTGTYLLGGLAGLAAYLLAAFLPPHLNISYGEPILGASAAVMAIFIFAATYQPNVEVTLYFVLRMRLKYLAIALVVLDMIALPQIHNSGGHLAHLGGALYGFLAAKQLQNRGADWSGNFISGLERVWSFVRGGNKGRARMRVERGGGRKVRVVQDADFNAAKRDKQERVDAILDKISRSGYDSLSKDERDFLFKASNEQ